MQRALSDWGAIRLSIPWHSKVSPRSTRVSIDVDVFFGRTDGPLQQVLSEGDAICPPTPWHNGELPCSARARGPVETLTLSPQTYTSVTFTPQMILNGKQHTTALNRDALLRTLEDKRNIAQYIKQFKGMDEIPIDRMMELAGAVHCICVQDDGEIPGAFHLNVYCQVCFGSACVLYQIRSIS